MTSRLLEVEPERLVGWVERFGAAHGGASVAPFAAGAAADVGSLGVLAADGARADLEVPWPPLLGGSGPASGDPVEALAAHAAVRRTALVLLVRRGGWTAALARDGAVLDASGGTRYVQSRTAAGGWSQQRYARRRANQADGLVGAAAAGLEALLGRGAARPEVLVPGGDRQLVTGVLAGAPPGLLALPRGPLLDVPDPRRRVLDDVARRARCVRVRLTQP